MPFDLVRHDLLTDLKPLETRAHPLHRRRALPAPRAIRLAENRRHRRDAVMSDRTSITLLTCAPTNCSDTARHSPKVAHHPEDPRVGPISPIGMPTDVRLRDSLGRRHDRR
jgi:hypothetical protein